MENSPAERRAINHNVPPAIAKTLHHCAVSTGLTYSLCLAICEHESGFRNVWGHDAGKFRREGQITKWSIAEYDAAPATSRPQGIGPMQITSIGLQLEARNRGGLELSEVTTSVGVGYLADLVRRYGAREGVRRYNGSGPAAEAYATAVLARAGHWHTLLTR